MAVTLWVLSGIVAVVYAGAIVIKLQPKERYVASPFGGWAARWPAGAIKLLAVIEILGVLGLFLPVLTGIAPVLTPISAFGLAAIQIGAIYVLARGGETRRLAVNLVVLVSAVVVGIGRLLHG